MNDVFRKDAITLRDDAQVQLDLSWELLRMAMDDVSHEF
jgi:hypothetical protein